MMIRNVGLQHNNIVQNDMKNNEINNNHQIEKDAITKHSRIDELKKQIEHGNYQIDLRMTAIKMAQDLRPDL